MLREPVVIAKWLLVTYAAGVVALLGIPALLVWSAGEAGAILWSLPILAWVVGPAALAALLVVLARSRVEAWLFVWAEAATIASTAWLCSSVFLNTTFQNTQSGMEMLFLPLIQLAILLFYTSGVTGTALVLRIVPFGHKAPV